MLLTPVASAHTAHHAIIATYWPDITLVLSWHILTHINNGLYQTNGLKIRIL